MKHTIEGCLIRYNVPNVNGIYFSPEAFKDITGIMVPISTSYIFDKSESKIIGYAKLENREDGVYYKATLNDEKATDDMIDLVKNHDYFLGLYANQIKRDPKNMKCVIDGKIRAMAFTPKCDDAACVLTIDYEPLYKATPDKEKVFKGLEICTMKPPTCGGCPYYNECKNEAQRLKEDAFSILKEQDAEIRRLKLALDIAKGD